MTPFSTASALLDAIGINTHMNYPAYQDSSLVAQYIQNLGVRNVRDGMHFWPNQDAFNVNTQALDSLSANLCLVCDPSENLGSITASLFNLFGWGTCRRLKMIEGPNEVDAAGTISSTPAFQASLYISTKTMAQGFGVQVIAPSLANTANAPQLGNLSGDCDYGNLHAYPMGNPGYLPEGFLGDLLTEISAVSGSKPVIVTECGYFTAGSGCISETAQAKYLLRMLLSYFQAGAKQIYLYELLDQEPASAVTDPQLHFGLVRSDGTIKPSFTAVKNLISILGGAGSLVPLNFTLSGPSVSSLLFQDGTGWLLFLWQPVSVFNLSTEADTVNPSVQVTVGLPKSADCLMYAPLLQQEPIQTFSGTSIPVSVPDHPIAVRING